MRLPGDWRTKVKNANRGLGAAANYGTVVYTWAIRDHMLRALVCTPEKLKRLIHWTLACQYSYADSHLNVKRFQSG